MKILLIRKQLIIDLIILIFILILVCLASFCYYFSNSITSQTIFPVNPSKDSDYDLTGDGITDNFQLISNENIIDFNVKTSSSEFYFSKEVNDKILFTKSIHWDPKIFIHDLSRNNIPEIILMGSKNNKSIYYIFVWNNNKFNLIASDNGNILGILDCKNTKTPQCISLSSASGGNSAKSFMVVNNSALDTTSSNLNLPSLDSILNFINLVELPYNLDELPDIFTNNINKNELSILWNLDKDNYSYAFQNAFFYDYNWNDEGDPTAFKWRLSFEKSKLSGQDGDKEELCLFLDIIKDHSAFKITSIQKSK